MGLCASTPAQSSSSSMSAGSQPGGGSPGAAPAASGQIAVPKGRAGSMGEGDYRTNARQARGPSGRLGFFVPQSLLQKASSAADGTIAASAMPEPLRNTVAAVFAADDVLSTFSSKQLEAIVAGMTLVAVPAGAVLCDEVEGIYFVEEGTVEATSTSHTYGPNTYFGASSVFVGAGKRAKGGSTLSADDAETKTGAAPVKATSASKVWMIHRQLFQAVLIQQTMSADQQRSKVLSKIPMLAPLSRAQQAKVGSCMRRHKFAAGTKIITQGEVGNTMYFIESGEVVVYQKSRGEADPKEVNRHGAGGFFGEGALVNEGADGGVRNADCVAEKTTYCHAIEREDFQRLLGPMHELINIKSKARILKAVKLLSGLTDAEREEVARVMKRRVYAPGDAIITQGDPGDEFFVIESGEVAFTRVPEGGGAVEDIGRFFQNQFFGEGSLLTSDVRRATATAAGTGESSGAVCYSLSGAAFRMIFGDKLVSEMSGALEARKASDESADAKAASISVKDLNGIRILGEGSYGKVTLVRHEVTGRTYALKQIKKSHVKKMKQEPHIRTERAVLTNVNHPFVCNLVRTFKNSHSVYFLMEAVLGGELYAQMKRVKKFGPSHAKFYAAQVAAVFEHLHARHIIFRDLKPENLLIAHDGYLKMVDFGLAKHVPSGKTYTLCGTPAYASPEVYASVGHDKGVDWWTLGVLIHELNAGYTPFAGSEPNEIYKEITRYAKHYPRVAFPRAFSKGCSDILLGLLHPLPEQRLGNLSQGSAGIKNHAYFEDINWAALARKEVTPEFLPKIDDAFDSGNFKNRSADFEKKIEADKPGANHEPWAEEF
jgi:CRP-like cAMP-binding protein/tRNA A-37 threonylcarbamoyl transferase component Bud32